MERLDEKTVAVSMDIIMYAGDSRLHITQGFDAICQGDFLKAKEKLELAQNEITIAHRLQTERVQQEASGEAMGYSVLFSHAQDTLMTINSELIMAKRLLKVFESYEKRITALEGK